MQELIAQLHDGGYTCVVATKEGKVLTFAGRGIADLYTLYTERPETLRNSRIADKVIGRGAAALLVAGGAKSVYADVMSRPALELLQTHGIEADYAQLTEGIINRRGDGPCPVEHLCQKLNTTDEMIAAIRGFVESNRKNKPTTTT